MRFSLVWRCYNATTHTASALANYKSLKCYLSGKAPCLPRNCIYGDGGRFLFVRVIGVLIVSTGAAHASSFVAMGDTEPASTPSIVTFGAPAGDTRAWQSVMPASPAVQEAAAVTPSIVAMGEPWPEVTNEKVAAIPQKRSRGPRFQPLVIRGGLVGNAFAPAKPDGKNTATAPTQEASASQESDPEPSPAPDKPPAYLPPNGLGKHRW